MTKSQLTYSEYGNKDVVINNVSFQIKGPAKFELVSKDGKVLQSLDLNFKGSDDMSEQTYPIEVRDSMLQERANHGLGGCSTNSLKATQAE